MRQLDIRRYYVSPTRDRPDFRQVQAFLWGDGANIDSEGDCRYVSDRAWTELQFGTRGGRREDVFVHCHQRDPLVLAVVSSSPALAARMAYVLALSTGSGVSRDPAGPYEDVSVLLAQLGSDFSVGEALDRFTVSPFVRSTADNPYPNLEGQ